MVRQRWPQQCEKVTDTVLMEFHQAREAQAANPGGHTTADPLTTTRVDTALDWLKKHTAYLPGLQPQDSHALVTQFEEALGRIRLMHFCVFCEHRGHVFQ